MQILWTTIMTDKFQESLKFYQDIVGLEVSQLEEGEKTNMAFLGDESSSKLELVESKDQPNLKGVSIGLQIDSIDDKMAELKDKGLDIIGPISPSDEISFFFIEDPNGFRVQFVEYKI